MSNKILIIDDEKNIRRSIRMILEGEGFSVQDAADGAEGLNKYNNFFPDLILLDILMPGLDGLEVLRQIKDRDHQSSVIMISGHGTVQNAMDATRLGAFDFIEKPISKEKLLISVQRALENRSLQAENRVLRQQVDARYEMIGSSAAVQKIREQIKKVAPSTGRVLITGESGTGKELVARAIHHNSGRSDGPFVKVNCAAIPEELIEAELFGSEKGAYTGSVNQRDGKFLQADRGTLFLDEVGDMSFKVQAKVLRVLQEDEFERIGGTETLKVDIRVISATNKNLPKEADAGRFREDLLYRLNVVPIHVPPLRHRKEDIPLLVDYFTERYCEGNGFRKKTIDPATMDRLKEYDWPGNIRELQNLCERLVIMTGEGRITEKDFPGHILRTKAIFSESLSGEETLKELLQKVERDYIIWQLNRSDWNITRTAQLLGIERSNLHKKIVQYKINRDE